MKLILVALVTLAVALGSTGGQTMEEKDPMEEKEPIFDIDPKKIVRELFKGVKDFVDGTTEQLKIDPGKVGMMIANMLPEFDPAPKMAKFYGKFCGINGCNETGHTCLDFLFPPEVGRYHKECIPDIMRSLFMKDKSAKKTMMTCFFKKMTNHHNVEYQEDPKANCQNILDVMIATNGTALTEKAKDNLREAYDGLCQFPPEEFCMTDVMKFTKCAVNSCVRGMYYA